MSSTPLGVQLPQPATAFPWRSWLSRAALTVALLLLAATFLLFSPPAGQTYPGAIPWATGSVLRRIVDFLSLGGAVQTARGVEIKSLALHLAAVVGLLLLGGRALVSALQPAPRRATQRVWLYGQILLGAWALLSLCSTLWSQTPDLVLGQSALYLLLLAWAVALAWTLELRHVATLLLGYVVLAAIAGGLCIWYYFERNPVHRPGFPIGNPSALAAVLLPAIVIAGCALVGALQRALRDRPAGAWLSAAALIALLVPLLWAFALAGSRGAAVALLAAITLLILAHVGRRTRWIVLIAGLLIAVGLAWYLYASRLDIAMARGATIRFRVYTWKYATYLWTLRPLSGHGAGAFPRLASQLAVPDRALDPAAFMGEMVEHAHNELFEVFVEIGLVGGVTYVAGLLATLVAAQALLRTNLSSQRRWLLLGLVAGFIALFIDALFGVSLRLPGAPAVFATLLGTLWAAARFAFRERPAGDVDDDAARPVLPSRERLTRFAFAGGCALAAIAAGVVTWTNWTGVLAERRAQVALAAGDTAAAQSATQLAAARLLDPVRRISADIDLATLAYDRAERAFQTWIAAASQLTSENPQQTAAAAQQVDALGRAARDACLDAFAGCQQQEQRVPAVGFMPAKMARVSEWLGRLYQGFDPATSREYFERAAQAWQWQRRLRPYDEETLLALLNYPVGTLNDKIDLLRDALRNGLPDAQWYFALRRVAATPGIDLALRASLQVIGPYDAATSLDTLIISMAPETLRFAAAYHALRGEYALAASEAARAADLYAPMTPRFPTLRAAATAERAEYVFRADPTRPDEALALLRAAIEALPRVSANKAADESRPLRIRLAGMLLADGREQDAAEVLSAALGPDVSLDQSIAEAYVGLVTTFIPLPPERRPPVGQWLEAALRRSPTYPPAWAWKAWLAGERGDLAAIRATLQSAAAAGLSPAQRARIVSSLCQEFPSLCGALQGD